MDPTADPYRSALAHHLTARRKKHDIFKAVVNAPFIDPLEAARMCLGIVVLLMADQKDSLIHRVALSDTELAKSTTLISVKKFEDIKIPLQNPENLIARAIRSGKPQTTSDWHYLFTPVLSAEEARFNQAGGAIACSVVYPLKRSGALIFSYYQYLEKIDSSHHAFMDFYSALVTKRLARYL